MSQSVIFGIGSVIFIAVAAAVFIYGMKLFRGWEAHDDADSGSSPGSEESGVDAGVIPAMKPPGAA